MKIMNRLTWRSMWENRTRTIVTIIGVVLSAAMFTAVTTMAFSFWSFLVENEIYNSGDYFLRYDYTAQEHLDELENDERVNKLGDLRILGYHSLELEEADGGYLNEIVAVAAGDEAFYDMVTVILEEGRLPQTSSELVINRNAYYYLQLGGMGCEVGDTVTLEVTPEYEWSYTKLPDGVELSADGETFTRTYTIVGIAELFTQLGDAHLDMSHLFTYADGNEGDALWHRAYVKTWNPTDANGMQKENPAGTFAVINKSLMELYGATKYNNYNNLIGAVCGVLLAIIMVGSVSLIYNAFSISVSERTKQFGLLASIGATRKQLRSSVYFEALTLCAMGIPVGILCGYVGIAVTLEWLKSVMWSVLSSAGGSVVLRAVPSGWAFLAAAAVAAITVLISAWIPARRATKIAPITAIRQNQEYKIPKRGIQGGKFAKKLWGLPGLLAKKYYTVSKKKYRTTVLSLTVSILLFVSATSIVGVLQMAANNAVNTNNFDIRCYSLTEEQLVELREQGFVEQSALLEGQDWITVIPEENQAEDYLDAYEKMPDYYQHMSLGVKELRVYYLEDTVLYDYLEDHGIDPEPYFNTYEPAALVIRPKITAYQTDEETGLIKSYILRTGLVSEGVEKISVYPRSLPDEAQEYISNLIGNYSYMTSPTDDRLIYACSPIQDTSGGIIAAPEMDPNAVRVTPVLETNAEGKSVIAYYMYDPETDTIDAEPFVTVEHSDEIPEFKLGAMIDEIPFGLYADYGSDDEAVAVILPLSALRSREETLPDLSVKINDYNAATAYLTENDIAYDDLLASEKQARDIILMVNVFSYGFIILITMISVANVFNTISTNIALRRRDFGMLRSVGMKNGELYRMVGVECLSYGGRALLWGVPLSLAIDYGIQMIATNVSNDGYAFPIGTVAIVVVSVFAIVYLTTFYAVSKLRKDNPIDAIRMENT